MGHSPDSSGDHALIIEHPDPAKLDTYEASVWQIPNPTTTNVKPVRKVQNGTATAADLAAGGATQRRLLSDDDVCADNGSNCKDEIYAVSIAGVTPSAYMTWFQAQQACANARKRLPSNAEWQMAVAGTPDDQPQGGRVARCEAVAQDAPAGGKEQREHQRVQEERRREPMAVKQELGFA